MNRDKLTCAVAKLDKLVFHVKGEFDELGYTLELEQISEDLKSALEKDMEVLDEIKLSEEDIEILD